MFIGLQQIMWSLESSTLQQSVVLPHLLKKEYLKHDKINSWCLQQRYTLVPTLWIIVIQWVPSITKLRLLLLFCVNTS